MAREYARYLTNTHVDPDWRELTTSHHDTYMALLSSPDISWCGVVPYIPARFVLARDLTERKVAKLWDELAEAGMLIIDKSTGEVLVRGFINHDNVVAKPNLTKALLSALDKVRSGELLAAITTELGRLYVRRPDMAGWRQIEELFPELFDELLREGIEE